MRRIAIASSIAALSIAALVSASAAKPPAPSRWDAPGARNPLLPGYFADPSIVRDKGRWYIFATIDPWGDDRLGLWTSDDFRNWTFSTPAWPTKAAATSKTSGDAKVWAPSVVKAANGRWYMYVSVGSEIWVGSAPSPAGPWADANDGKPLIPGDFRPGYHMIDAEAFIDDDGQAYLFWGSGLNWVNGRCFVARLDKTMTKLDGAPKDCTPAHYFEAPFLVKSGGSYLLTYSWGNTTRDTYQVRYAVGKSPMGPFTEAPNSPILETHADRQIISPGHHAIFRYGNRPYILYQRNGLPYPPADKTVLRQVAVDALTIDGDRIARVTPTHDGVNLPGQAAHRATGLPWRASASSAIDAEHAPQRAGDDNYATAWIARGDDTAPWLQADLGRVRQIQSSSVRPFFPGRAVDISVAASTDGRRWTTIVAPASKQGSPIVMRHFVKARYLRLYAKQSAVIEWTIK